MRSLVLVVALAGCSGPGLQSDWEREHLARAGEKEADVVFPAYPQAAGLVEFGVPGSRDFRFFVDESSLQVGDDAIVRYVLVARSASGVENISFEGMRCRTREYRIYAVGQGGGWTERPGSWQPVRDERAGRWHRILAREYLCPDGRAVADAREARLAFRAANSIGVRDTGD